MHGLTLIVHQVHRQVKWITFSSREDDRYSHVDFRNSVCQEASLVRALPQDLAGTQASRDIALNFSIAF